jgi:hypothetical protein
VEASIARYAPILGFNNLSIDHEVVTSLSKLPEFSIVERTLKQELHLNFSDREVRLLKILIAWFSQEQRNSSTKFKPYGVREFWPVWESVCKFIYRDQVALWLKKIPPPLWTRSDGEYNYSTGKWLPDVIMACKPHNYINQVFILDAKYYDCRLPPSLSGEPGVGDITKQLFYSQILESEVYEEGYDGIINGFVFPAVQENFIETSGKVEIEGIRGGPIMVIYMNLTMAFERYLSSTPITNEEQLELGKECFSLHSFQNDPLKNMPLNLS